MINGNPEKADQVDYIKSQIQTDIAVNLQTSGRDYSPELGTILGVYLSLAQTEETLNLAGNVVGNLEGALSTTGKTVSFLETKKCGSAIHQLWKDDNKEGLEEIQRYARELITKNH